MTEQDLTLCTAATYDDAERIAQLARPIWQEHYTPIIGAGQVAYMLDRFQSADQIWHDLTERGYVYQWLRHNGEDVAYMAYRPEPGTGSCFLSKLYVAGSSRGRGLARYLFNELTRYCRETGCTRIWLTVNRENHDSIAVYKKIGFLITQDLVTDIGCGYVMDDYVMQIDVKDETDNHQ